MWRNNCWGQGWAMGLIAWTKDGPLWECKKVRSSSLFTPQNASSPQQLNLSFTTPFSSKQRALFTISEHKTFYSSVSDVCEHACVGRM